MKKLLLSLCLLICGLMAYAQSYTNNITSPTHIVIKNRYNGTIIIPLSDNPKMTFNFKFHRIYINTTDIRYDILLNFDTTISYENTSAIESIESTKCNIELQMNQLCFNSNKANTHISIVDIKGNVIMSQVIGSENYYYSLSGLIPGIYIAQINNTTIKFIKR